MSHPHNLHFSDDKLEKNNCLIFKYIPVCLKSKCTDFLMDELVTWHLVNVYQRVGSDLGCMFELVSSGLVASVMH